MKKELSLLVLSLLVSTTTFAGSNAPIEAWLSASSFDGNTFQYQYTAYDTKEILSEENLVLCEYSSFQGKPTLSAVQVKVLIDAEFNSPGSKVEKRGSIDIRKGINDCLAKGPRSLKRFNSPVQIKLPPISVPARGL